MCVNNHSKPRLNISINCWTFHISRQNHLAGAGRRFGPPSKNFKERSLLKRTYKFRYNSISKIIAM